MPALPACPDRCGGAAVWEGIEPEGATRYRCSRCGEVWWTPPPEPPEEEK